MEYKCSQLRLPRVGEVPAAVMVGERIPAKASQRWMMMILLLFLQKQNLAFAIYLFGLGTRLSGPGLKHMR